MKVELISETFSYDFETRINEFISKKNVSVIDIKYSTNCIRKEEHIGNTVRNVDTIIYTALILYDELIDYEDLMFEEDML